MVIDNLNVVRITIAPDEADPVLVVDADAVLPLPITGQRFEAMTRIPPEIIERAGRVEQRQPPEYHMRDPLETTRELFMEEMLDRTDPHDRRRRFPLSGAALVGCTARSCWPLAKR